MRFLNLGILQLRCPLLQCCSRQGFLARVYPSFQSLRKSCRMLASGCAGGLFDWIPACAGMTAVGGLGE